MNTLLVILCVCVILRFIQQLYLDIKSSHRKSRYETMRNYLRRLQLRYMENQMRYRKDIDGRDATIRRLENQLAMYKAAYPDFESDVQQEETVETMDDVEESEVPALD